MSNGIYSAVAGAVANTRELEVISNNLANVSTPGFKAARIPFAEILARAAQGGAADATARFVEVSETASDIRQGRFTQSDDPLDIVLDGPGYLVMRRGDKVLYGRGGHLALSKEGFLETSEGYQILGSNDKPIKITSGSSSLGIMSNGDIRLPSGAVGTLKIVEFSDPRGLERIGGNLYRAPKDLQAQSATATQVRQGLFETSNVNIVKTMSDMMMATRRYEALHRVISTFAEVDMSAARRVGSES